jgi:hypothetical protein
MSSRCLLPTSAALLFRFDHDRRLEREPVPSVELGVNRRGPVARLGKFYAVHLPQAALDLGCGADDPFDPRSEAP